MSNPRWFSIISFNSFALALCLGALTGCTNLGGDGSSSASSTKACAGEGGLFPSPIGPQSVRAYEKYSLPKSVFTKSSLLKSDTSLVAIINEKCVLQQPSGGTAISQTLRKEVEAQASPISERAYSLKLEPQISAASLQQRVSNDPCLVSLSEDAIAYPTATSVNDPGFASQTHLTGIQAPDAWDTFYAGISGEVIIAIIDDGMQMDHPDLMPSLWVNPGEIASNGIDDDGNGYVDDINGYNFASNIASPAQQNGSSHGTHVAGLAAAKDNNSVGVTGVMGRNVKIMALNVFGTNPGSSAPAILNAINYARDKGAHVINMSLGGPGTASSIRTAMSNAVAAGTFIAVAAGNDNQLVTSSAFVYPMGYAKDIEGAMAVGSIDAVTLEKSSFSNYSTTYVEIAAPGSDDNTGGVLSTYPTSTYQYLQGTSMASPVLAGAAALVIGYVRAQGGTITPAQVESYLKSSADTRGGLTPYFLGGGALNLKNLAATAQCAL